MNADELKQKIEFVEKLEYAGNAHSQWVSTRESGLITLFSAAYGPTSNQFTQLQIELDVIRTTTPFRMWDQLKAPLIKAKLVDLKYDVENDLLTDTNKLRTGEVLGDFLALARDTLAEGSAESFTKVAAVLAAALFEDTIHRLAEINNLTRQHTLSDELIGLKQAGVLIGTAMSTAQSYLTFRNKALHAEWDKIDRPTVSSVLAFTEGLLLKHFS